MELDGRGARPHSNYIRMYLEVNGLPVLTPPKPELLSAQVGMRTSLRGTQASGEGKSQAQDANVAEVSYGEPVIGKSEYPDNHGTTRRR